MSESDQIARDIAKDALARIEGHEAVCAERQLHIAASLTQLQRGVDRINGRFMAGAGTVIVLLLTACAGLLIFILRMQH